MKFRLSMMRFAKRPRRVPTGLVAVVAVTVGLACVGYRIAQPPGTVANVASAEAADPAMGERGEAIRLRGRALRTALDDAFLQLRAARSLTGAEAPLTRIVTRSIPIGSPLDEARAILHFAGFEIRNVTNIGRPFLSATIEPYLQGGLQLFSTTLYVSIDPTSDLLDHTTTSTPGSNRVARVRSSLMTIYP